MPTGNTEQRKLAAIMFTDMVGYSALAQRYEALALELLEVQMALGNQEAAIAGFQDWFNRKRRRWPGKLEALRYDQFYAPLRSNPRIQQLITLGEGWLREGPRAAGSNDKGQRAKDKGMTKVQIPMRQNS